MKNKDIVMLRKMYETYEDCVGAETEEAIEANDLVCRCFGALDWMDEKKPYDMKCPGCGEEIKFMPMNKEAHPVTHCWLCGHAIDWSE